MTEGNAPREWTVVWEIQVVATSPVEAAKEAREIQQSPEAVLAQCYTVFPMDQPDEKVEVDLYEEERLFEGETE